MRDCQGTEHVLGLRFIQQEKVFRAKKQFTFVKNNFGAVLDNDLILTFFFFLNNNVKVGITFGY